MKAVIFDFGKVLGTFDKMRACALFADYSSYSPTEIYDIITTQLEKMLESGQMSETAFCNELLHRCKVHTLTVPDGKRIWGNIFGSNPAIEPVIDQLIDQRTPIGVLSNTNAIHWPYIEDLPVMRKLKRYGAPFTLSYVVKAYKPDRRLYEAAFANLGTKAAETLYLDDIQEYVEAARAIGMKAEQYDCTKDPERISGIMNKYGFLKEIV